MKIRTDHVTNSSSSSFVIFGKDREHIMSILKKKEIFGKATENVLRYLKGQRAMKGETLKKYYEDNIMYVMQLARTDAMNYLTKEHPYDWLYSADMSSRITKEAALISDVFLSKNVALVVNLGDDAGYAAEERCGWQAAGFNNHDASDFNDMVLVVGINGH